LITTRKFKLAIVSDNKNESFSFIRNEIRNQSKALNVAYSHLYFEHIAQDKIKHSDTEYQEQVAKYKNSSENKYRAFLKLKERAKSDDTLLEKVEKAREDYNKAQEKVYKLEKEFNKKSREVFQQVVGLARQTRIAKVIRNQFDLNPYTIDRISATVLADFTTDLKMGVLKGERSLRNYKSDFPLMIRSLNINLYEEKGDFYIKWIKGIIFKIILSEGSKQRANLLELKTTLQRLIERTYKICDSSISFDKDLILNLSIDIPVTKENVFIPSRVVGVDLGLKIPAYVSLNDSPYIRKAIGTIDDFLKVRTQLQSQRRRLQKALQSTKGGKGREKKLQGLERVKAKEKNFVTTYNHFLSKSIIQFALKNNAGMIYLEELKFDKLKHTSILRNWSYYQLQTMIEYKAKREGIKIFYVDSSYTSQTCSKCGHLEEGQRISQDQFTCKKCEFSVNADYNASQNIARGKAIKEEKQLELEF
jgi:IS605 OrfB family transposase